MEKKDGKYFDYLGNEIKEGMIIHLVSTKSFAFKMHGRAMNKGGVSGEKTMEMDFPAVDEWRVILEFEVTTNDMFGNLLLARTLGGDVTIEQSLGVLFTRLSENQVIAIKGISDKPNN